MAYYGPRIAYAFDDAKIASLWFDHVIPVDDSPVFDHGLFCDYSLGPSKANFILRNILPPELANDRTFFKTCEGYLMENEGWMRLDCERNSYPSMQEIISTSQGLLGPQRQSTCYFNSSPSYQAHLAELAETGMPSLELADDQIQASLCPLPGLSLIAPSSLTWEEVLEFRKDADSVRKLRRLRLYMASAYENKDFAYVRDDLLRRMDEYEETIRQWQFKTTTHCLREMLSTKSLPALAAAAVAASLGSGMSMAVATGALFELAIVGTNLADRIRELREIKSSSPIAYLLAIKQGSKNGRQRCAGLEDERGLRNPWTKEPVYSSMDRCYRRELEETSEDTGVIN